jgi:LEA14-like dessication related protein
MVNLNRNGTLAAICLILAACAGTEALVATPKVRLTSVELQDVSFTEQTFLLGFEVENPNGFPLPVEAIKYRVQLDGERFAGGEAAASFTIPAHGEGAFQVSVRLDILTQAATLSSLLHGGVPENVSYRVDGSLAVDIPFTRPLTFASTGVIAVVD